MTNALKIYAAIWISLAAVFAMLAWILSLSIADSRHVLQRIVLENRQARFILLTACTVVFGGLSTLLIWWLT